jgi:diguanylate cyclase (GGDEF)-like protein
VQNLFNYKILRLIPIVFLIVIAVRIVIDYDNTINREYNFVKKEAQVLNTYALAHRDYYQHLFIDKTLTLNQKTIKALPAFSSFPISNIFSKENKLNITLHTVSNNPRDQKNKADSQEMKAIKFFNQNKNAKEYFKKNIDFYQYASALRIEKKCLLCHGAKKDAPKFIREKYSSAYDYKLGDTRGIMSIKIPAQKIHNYFFKGYIESVFYDIVLSILLFFGISYITKKSKIINTLLEKEVAEKTKELSNIFNTDKLTKLPNRNKLIEDIEQSKNSASKHLAFINIDSFKDINDFYGYKFGDKILNEIGIILKLKCLCEKSAIYKLPSDEFALFSSSSMSKLEFEGAISKIMSDMNSMSFIIDENKIFLGFSCGLASDEENLMRKADVALRIAKNKNEHLVIFEESLDLSSKIKENSEKVSLLRNAIEFDQITPYFQPIYNVNTNKIEKYECLVRIVQSDKKVILPYEFLDVAIKSKQYPLITKNMINKSFEFFKDKDFEFSINLSIFDILNSNTVDFIIKKLEACKNPQKIVFEILENDKIENYEKTKSFISKIKKFGCKFAVDDFGSGYSNFAHVYELNLDYIKIDASLVKNITKDEKSKIITKSIIDFAASLNIKTIAEFVEDKESLELLRDFGADFIQGYYIGKPNKKLIS